jgi:hypothetical protein
VESWKQCKRGPHLRSAAPPIHAEGRSALRSARRKSTLGTQREPSPSESRKIADLGWLLVRTDLDSFHYPSFVLDPSHSERGERKPALHIREAITPCPFISMPALCGIMATDADVSTKRKADVSPLESPRTAKCVKMEDEVQETGRAVSKIPSAEKVSVSAPMDYSGRGNITIIHAPSNGKTPAPRMQWTFPRSYIAARKRSVSPAPRSPAPVSRNDTELNTSNLHGTYTPEAISIFYQAVTSETSVSSSKHTLHEYCQIYALAHFFGITDIFTDGETILLRRIMTDDMPLETVRAATSFASVFRWRSLVERCRFLLTKRVKALEADLPNMNCGGLNILATKLDEAYEYLSKAGLLVVSEKK